MSAPTPSDAPVLVRYDILAGKEVSVLNELYALYGNPGDEFAELTLRDSDDQEVLVQIERIESLEEDPGTGATHFTGKLVGGGDISGHVRPGPATELVVGKAAMSIVFDIN